MGDFGDHIGQTNRLALQSPGIGSQSDYTQGALIVGLLDAGIEEKESDGVAAHVIGIGFRGLVAGAEGAFERTIWPHDLCQKRRLAGKLRRAAIGNEVVFDRVPGQGQNVFDDLSLLGLAVRRAVNRRLDLVVSLAKFLDLGAGRDAKLLLHVLAGKLINELALGVFFFLIDGQAIDGQVLLQNQILPAPAPGIIRRRQEDKDERQQHVDTDQRFSKCAHMLDCYRSVNCCQAKSTPGA